MYKAFECYTVKYPTTELTFKCIPSTYQRLSLDAFPKQLLQGSLRNLSLFNRIKTLLLSPLHVVSIPLIILMTYSGHGQNY